MSFKNLTIVIIFALIFIPLYNSNAEGEKRYHHAITGDPVTDVLGYGYGVFATYEQQLTARNSFTVFGHFQTWDRWSHLGVGGSYRWYIKINKDPLEGLSFGPFLLFEYAFTQQTGINQKGLLPSLGAEAAYKFIFDSFVVEPIFKLNIGVMKPTGYGAYRFIGVGCNLGYAWQ